MRASYRNERLVSPSIGHRQSKLSNAWTGRYWKRSSPTWPRTPAPSCWSRSKAGQRHIGPAGGEVLGRWVLLFAGDGLRLGGKRRARLIGAIRGWSDALAATVTDSSAPPIPRTVMPMFRRSGWSTDPNSGSPHEDQLTPISIEVDLVRQALLDINPSIGLPCCQGFPGGSYVDVTSSSG